MKILPSLIVASCVHGKYTGDKGLLSVSHRNMFTSELPITFPSEDDDVPDFIINGVNKCGTTAASFFLEKHSELQKAFFETNFFNTDGMYEKGFSWYSQQFPTREEGKKMYEKTPAYYKSHVAPERIKAMNEDVQLITVVCDNVHRTLSRFLHIQKHAQQKLPKLGYTLEEFNNNLRTAVVDFQALLDEIRENEGDNTFEGLIQALSHRYQNDMRPFSLGDGGNHFELILADGFYAVHHDAWLRHFSPDQLLVVNGNNFLRNPWVPLKRIQSFLGIEHQITRESFIVPVDADGTSGIPCFIEPGQEEANCIGKGESEKGRSLDKKFTEDVGAALHELFRPFDEYYAHQILQRKTFDWNFGLE